MAFQVALVVKNPPATAEDTETLVQSLGWEDPLEGGRGNPLQYSCLANSKDRGAWWAMVHRVTKNRTWLRRLSTQHAALTKYAHEALSDPPCQHHCHLQYRLLPFPTFCLTPSRSRCCFLSLGPCLGHISSAWNVPLCLLTCQLSLPVLGPSSSITHSKASLLGFIAHRKPVVGSRNLPASPPCGWPWTSYLPFLWLSSSLKEVNNIYLIQLL